MKDYKKTIGKFERDYDKKTVRTLNDLKDSYYDKESVRNILNTKGNIELYKVFIRDFSPIDLGLTVVKSGKIGKEFYFTKGHIHKNREPEFYILLDGIGELFLQKGKKSKTIKLKRGEISLIPVGWAHRLINIGSNKLKVLTIYHQNSKPDYSVIFKKRFFGK
ncbi:cupin domain-containing protein [Candidatus Pacearchaeota archaeon]|nr:cupin domain-containing protein [Candidatus Pacearchaeota archaeon]